MKRITVAFILWLLMFLAGCTSSQPATPKTIDSYKQLTREEAAKILRDAEAKQPCSEQNLRNASAEQKAKCNPTQGMFDHMQPNQPPTSAQRPQPAARLKGADTTNTTKN